MTTAIESMLELERKKGRAALAFDEFLSCATGLAIQHASLTDSMTAHLELIEPLRQLRAEAVAWINLVGVMKVDEMVQVPTLPSVDDDDDPDQLYRRPEEQLTQ